MNENMLINFILTQEVSRYSKKTSRLGYHLGRCKQKEDKAKLLVMIAINVKIIESTMVKLVDNLHEIKDVLIKPRYYA